MIGRSHPILRHFNISNVIFALFLIFVGAAHVLWISIDNQCRGNDASNHLVFSIDFFNRTSHALAQAPSFLSKVFSFLCSMGTHYMRDCPYWPEGLSASAYGFYYIFGKSFFAARLTLLPYILILLVSTYSLGRYIYSRSVGLVAAVILFFYPIIFQSSRQYQLDFPLTALVALGMLLLLKSDGFRNTKYSILFGLVSGWAMLIKGQYLFFLAGPLVYVLWNIWRESGVRILRSPWRASEVRHILMALMLGGLIASLWWGPHGDAIWRSFLDHIFNKEKNQAESFFSWDKKYSFEAIFFHVWALAYCSVRPLFSGFLIAALPGFLREKIRGKGVLLCWMIPPILLFSLVFSIKHVRFLMPILPALALITAAGLCAIRHNALRRGTLALAIILGMVQFYVLSFLPDNNRELSLGRVRIFGQNGVGADYETNGSPRNQTLAFDALVSEIKGHHSGDKPPFILLLLNPNVPPVYFELPYYVLIREGAWKVTNLMDMSYGFPENLHNIDFVLYQALAETDSMDPGKAPLEELIETDASYNAFFSAAQSDPQYWKGVSESVRENNDSFQLVSRIGNSNGTVFYLFKRGGAR